MCTITPLFVGSKPCTSASPRTLPDRPRPDYFILLTQLNTIAMKCFYCLILLLCPLWDRAQPLVQRAPLSIGDQVPDIQFNDVLNAPIASTSLAASFDKLLLVDFWATWCGSCIREFPKLDSLQQTFKDRLNILLVNNPKSGDDKKKITAFFEKKRNAAGKKYALPVLLNDTLLAAWFSHNTIPHTVWIYRTKVIAITEASAVTAANIQTVLDGKTIAFDTKEDQMNFDFHQPLLENENGGTPAALLYKAVFTKYLKGAGGAVGQVLSADSLLLRKFYINKSVLSLYNFAFPELASNRLVLDEELYSSLLSDTQNLKWKTDHYFCYEQTLAFGTDPVKQQQCMQLDLDRQFGLYSRLEKRLVPCYVFRLRNAELLTKAASISMADGIQKDESGYWVVKDLPIAALAALLNRQSAGKAIFPVVLDETGYALPVSINLRVKNLHDLESLQKVLPSLGLELIRAEREVEMLVISKQHLSK